MTRGVAASAVLALAVGTFAAGATTASAATVLCDPATNHCYEVVSVSTRISWPAAKAAAEAKTYNGFSGHLVTITSQAETDFLLANGQTAAQHWIGASQPIGQTGPASNWFWVTGSRSSKRTGPPASRTSSTGRRASSYLEFWYPAGKWNDQNNAFLEFGYVVEYDRPMALNDCKKGAWETCAVFKNQGRLRELGRHPRQERAS